MLAIAQARHDVEEALDVVLGCGHAFAPEAFGTESVFGLLGLALLLILLVFPAKAGTQRLGS
jgi:hypothetical protein